MWWQAYKYWLGLKKPFRNLCVCVFFHMATLLNHVSLPSNAPTGAMRKLAAWARGSSASCFLSLLMTTQATKRNKHENKQDTSAGTKWAFLQFLIGFIRNSYWVIFHFISEANINRHQGHMWVCRIFFSLQC